MKELHEIGIESLYHRFTGEDQGKETHPTFYLHRRKEKPYHIDYIFAAQEFASRIKKLEIGPYDPWIRISDHLPLVCEFEEERIK